MPKRIRSGTGAAVLPSKGKKITFGDDDDDLPMLDEPLEREQVNGVDSGDDEDEDEDEDDAPEAVGMSVGRQAEQQLERSRQSEELSKRQAAKLRLQKIQALKDQKANKGPLNAEASSSSSKGKPSRSSKTSKPRQKEVDDDGAASEGGGEVDDAETRRLRARMEKAMEEGSGDSEDEDEDEEDLEMDYDDDEHDDDEVGSFHTEDGDSEDDVDEAEEDDDSDDSETLRDGPLTAEDIRMRALMDKAMAAADKRAGIEPRKPSKPGSTSTTTEASGSQVRPATSKGKGKETASSFPVPVPSRAARSGKTVTGVDEDDETMWDMTPGLGGPKPLSAAMLAAAAKEEKDARERKKREALCDSEKNDQALSGRKRKKRRQDKAEKTVHMLENGTTVQLLAPRLDSQSQGGLPPVIAPNTNIGSRGSDSRQKFMRKAMKFSGQLPGKGMVDGRKRAVTAPRG